jgi:hypothetical protein
MSDHFSNPRSMKSLILCAGGVAAAFFSIVGNMLLAAIPNFDQSITRGVLCVVIVLSAYLAERMSQLNAGVTLNWGGIAKGRLALFAIYMLIWAGVLKLSWDGLFDSPGLFAQVIDAVIIYMFAAAFFEMLNLLKNGGGK